MSSGNLRAFGSVPAAAPVAFDFSMKYRLAQLGWIITSLLSLAACSSQHRIEPVQDGSAPGAAGGGGDGSPNAGSGGQAGKSGNEAGGGGNGGASDEGGAGGASQTGSPVHGRVIDFWGHNLSGVPVQVDGKGTTTDANGSFSVDNVRAEYDASVVVQYLNAVTQTHAYLYQGLTRRDPTLQVYRGYADSKANLDTPLSNSEMSLTTGRKLTVAMGGRDGTFERQYSSPGGASLQVKWVGPAATMESVFALVWQPNATTALPEGYFAFARTAVALDATNVAKVIFDVDLTPLTLATTTASGSVVPANSGTRRNSVSVRFPSGATIRVANDRPPEDAFSYVVPILPEASLAIVAAEGCGMATESCAIVHKEVETGGDFGMLAIPTPATSLVVSPPGAVDASTAFSFTLPGGTGRATVSIFDNGSGNDRLVVITSKPSFKIPAVINGSYGLVHGASYIWSVTTHGNQASVDEMAAPSGYLDSCGFYTLALEPNGPTHIDGTFTSSAGNAVTIAN
jgi:hypothetical protein